MYYTQTLEKEFKAYCIADYEYSNLFTYSSKVVKKGDIIDILHMSYETNNIDKVVTYSYIIKDTNHSVRKFSDYFITLNTKRKMTIDKLLKEGYE